MISVDRLLAAAARCQLAGDLAAAEAACRQAIALQPDSSEARNNLGVMLEAQGRLAEAEAEYRRAIAARPDNANAHYNLGNTLYRGGRAAEAVSCYAAALAIRPDYAEALNNLGAIWRDAGQLRKALVCYDRAVAARPDYVAALRDLGGVHLSLGEHDAAESCFRRAVASAPNDAETRRYLLAAALYRSAADPASCFAERLEFGRQFGPARVVQFANVRVPERRLRVGYLSSDLRRHPVGHLMLRFLAQHDRAAVEAYAYALDPRADDVTTALKSHCALWRDAAGLDDTALADTIRRDGIDILVCLAGHFDRNRVGIAAQRAAPVQVSLHDGATSGVAGLDYFLTDPVLHPEGSEERFSETLVPLSCLYNYAPPVKPAGAADSFLAAANAYVTFGSFNNPAKLTDRTLTLWGDVLRAVPASRLLLKFKNWFGDERLRTRVVDRLGAKASRVAFAVETVDAAGLRALYARVDVALDPTPFNGATTTFEALSAGVPVVTLAGRTLVGRMAAAHLVPAGLGDLVARDAQDYVRIAATLAADVDRRLELRASLPARLAASPLCDAAAFARGVEAAYRRIWRNWCGEKPSAA